MGASPGHADDKKEVKQRLFGGRKDSSSCIQQISWTQQGMPLKGGRILLPIDCFKLACILLYLQEKVSMRSAPVMDMLF